MVEAHNQRLTDTINNLLAESDERLKVQMKEKMSSLQEKVVLSKNSLALYHHQINMTV